jgi:hypothetical protein
MTRIRKILALGGESLHQLTDNGKQLLRDEFMYERAFPKSIRRCRSIIFFWLGRSIEYWFRNSIEDVCSFLFRIPPPPTVHILVFYEDVIRRLGARTSGNLLDIDSVSAIIGECVDGISSGEVIVIFITTQSHLASAKALESLHLSGVDLVLKQSDLVSWQEGAAEDMDSPDAGTLENKIAVGLASMTRIRTVKRFETGDVLLRFLVAFVAIPVVGFSIQKLVDWFWRWWPDFAAAPSGFCSAMTWKGWLAIAIFVAAIGLFVAARKWIEHRRWKIATGLIALVLGVSSILWAVALHSVKK